MTRVVMMTEMSSEVYEEANRQCPLFQISHAHR